MNFFKTKQEKAIIKIAGILDKKMDELLITNLNDYVVFDGNTLKFTTSLESALKLGEDEFGKSANFVIRKIRSEPIVFGCLFHV